MPFLHAPSSACSLQLEHAAEHAALARCQLGGRTLLNYATFVQYDDFVGSLHSAHTMRDHKHGFVRKQTRKGFLHTRLVFHIERSGCLVEQKYRRIL